MKNIISDMWKNIKQSDIHVFGDARGEIRKTIGKKPKTTRF